MTHPVEIGSRIHSLIGMKIVDQHYAFTMARVMWIVFTQSSKRRKGVPDRVLKVCMFDICLSPHGGSHNGVQFSLNKVHARMACG